MLGHSPEQPLKSWNFIISVRHIQYLYFYPQIIFSTDTHFFAHYKNRHYRNANHPETTF